jgi:hypothetical protein
VVLCFSRTLFHFGALFAVHEMELMAFLVKPLAQSSDLDF